MHAHCFRCIFKVAKKIWRPKFDKFSVLLLRLASVYMKPTFFKSNHPVRNYSRSILGSDSYRFKLHFALIHPLPWLFKKEWIPIVIPKWQLSVHNFFELDFNYWRVEFFLRIVWNAIPLVGACTRSQGATPVCFVHDEAKLHTGNLNSTFSFQC